MMGKRKAGNARYTSALLKVANTPPHPRGRSTVISKRRTMIRRDILAPSAKRSFRGLMQSLATVKQYIRNQIPTENPTMVSPHEGSTHLFISTLSSYHPGQSVFVCY